MKIAVQLPMDQFIVDEVVHLVPQDDMFIHTICMCCCACDPTRNEEFPIVYHHIVFGRN